MTSVLEQINTKAIAIGEIHGIRNLTPIKISLLESLLECGNKVFLGLERDFDQSESVNHWMRTGEVPIELIRMFESPKTSSFLCDQFEFLSHLSHLYRTYPNQLQVHCLDISFSAESEDELSKKIRKVDDEDAFDSQREKFIIDQLSGLKNSLDSSDKIVWIAGNMHCSKTDFYFPIQGSPVRHIETVSYWLDSQYGCTSMYSLPFEGENTYQMQGKLDSKRIQTPLWAKDATVFDGIKKSAGIINHSEFSKAYDWVFGVKECIPSNSQKLF